MDTEGTTIAARLDISKSGVDPESIARIMFYETNRSDGDDNVSYDFVNAKRCMDVYADQIETDKFFAEEFSDPAWICPDLQQIELYKNPLVYKSGRNFVMVVNECPLAT